MQYYFIDLDGTMYHGTHVLDGAIEFIDALVNSKIPFLFLTNNSSRTQAQACEHMLKMGFKNILPQHFYTSAMAASDYIKATYPDVVDVNYLGASGLKEALNNNGFNYMSENPEFFFVGLDRNATYLDYSYALKYLLNGAKLVGTNNDRILLTEHGPNIGNGSIVALFEYATCQKAIEIGKPHRPIVDGALKYTNANPDDVVIIGDNLETDIMCGINAGIKTILVTTGVHQFEDCDKLKIRPDFIIANLIDLID